MKKFLIFFGIVLVAASVFAAQVNLKKPVKSSETTKPSPYLIIPDESLYRQWSTEQAATPYTKEEKTRGPSKRIKFYDLDRELAPHIYDYDYTTPTQDQRLNPSLER